MAGKLTTPLHDRSVDPWGRVRFNEKGAMEALYEGRAIQAIDLGPETRRHFLDACQLVQHAVQLPALPEPHEDAATYHRRLAQTWQVPPEFLTVDIAGYLLGKCKTPIERARIEMELREFDRIGATDILKILLHVMTVVHEAGYYWGVGRGSSVASYSLFLLEVHRVDSIKYGLDFAEFIKP